MSRPKKVIGDFSSGNGSKPLPPTRTNRMRVKALKYDRLMLEVLQRANACQKPVKGML